VIILLVATSAAVAQQPPQAPPQPQAEKLTPKVATGDLAKAQSDLAHEKAQHAWTEMKNLQMQANQAQTTYQNSLRDLQTKYADQQKAMEAYKNAVCKDNGWVPSEVEYNPESDAWTKIPKPAAQDKAAVKPPEEKK